MLALVKVRYGTLCKIDRRQLCRLQVRPVDGQGGRLRLRPKGFCQLCAEKAAQLLLHQGFFLILGGLGNQQEQCHAHKDQNADHREIAVHKRHDAPGDHQNNAQQDADALDSLIAAQLFGKLGIRHALGARRVKIIAFLSHSRPSLVAKAEIQRAVGVHRVDIHQGGFGGNAVQLHTLGTVFIIVRLGLGGKNQPVVILGEINGVAFG